MEEECDKIKKSVLKHARLEMTLDNMFKIRKFPRLKIIYTIYTFIYAAWGMWVYYALKNPNIEEFLATVAVFIWLTLFFIIFLKAEVEPTKEELHNFWTWFIKDYHLSQTPEETKV